MALFPFAVLVLLLLAVLFLFWALRRWTSPRGGGSRGPEARVPGVQRPYGVSESIGRRPTMEDRHRVLPLKRGLPHFRGPSGLPPTLYGVFDGHAGSAAADYCSARLGEVLMRDAAWPSAPAAALTSAFHVLDASFLELARLTSPPLNDGTTAVVALALGARLVVANVGDSRAVLVQRSGAAHALSDDHKPNRPDEVKRIQALGGAVFFHGVWRVQGVLAVSRAIGDRALKPYVSATPELRWWDCSPSDAALVLACDGLWDVLSNEQVADVVLAAMHPLPGREEAHEAAQRASAALVRQAILSGSTDNVTAIVVDLRGAAAEAAASGEGGGEGGGGGGGSNASASGAGAGAEGGSGSAAAAGEAEEGQGAVGSSGSGSGSSGSSSSRDMEAGVADLGGGLAAAAAMAGRSLGALTSAPPDKTD